MADFREQKYIIEIAKEQGIAKAAKNLYISQPALSQFLTRTEELYNIQLFERIGKRLVPTYAGEQYLKCAKQILDLDQNFRDQIADIKTLKKGFLSIGSTPGRGKDIFPVILPEFYRKYPQFDLRVYQETAQRLEELLRSGDIQVAVMTSENVRQQFSDFHVEELATEEISLIVSKRRSLQGVYKYGFRYPWVDIRQLENELFLVLNKGSRLRSVADNIFKDLPGMPRIMEFSSIDTIWRLVSEDMGIAFASDFNAPAVPGVDLLSIGSTPITWKFVILTRIGGYISVPSQYMIDLIKQFYKKEVYP